MKIKNLKIGTQLQLGVGLILFFVILLGFVAWYQADTLWKQTDGLYNHPLKVRREISELTTDVLKMHRSMKDIVQSTDLAKREQEIDKINRWESDSFMQIDSLFKDYLGPRKDIIDIKDALVKWKGIRVSILNFLKENNVRQAEIQTTHEGQGGAQVDSILKEIDDVSQFAFNKGNAFYFNAKESKIELERFLIILIITILVISLIIVFSLVRSLRVPLDEMMNVADDFREGDLDARMKYSSGNELGELAASFNRLAEANMNEIRCRELLNQISDVMLREDELHSFCLNVISVIMKSTGSQLGAIYMLNEGNTLFEPLVTIGLKHDLARPFSAEVFEGQFGISVAIKQINHLKEIPSDTPLIFQTTAGDFRPREMISIPILSGNEIIVMVSLASLSTYSKEALRLVTDIYATLTARFNGVLAHQKILEFSEKLESQNRELDERAKELSIQGQELSEQNLELEMQKGQLDEASRLKSTFLSNMSHELRTPLNSVIALSGVLSRRLQNKIPVDEYSYIEIIERNGRNLLALINDVLDLSRIEAGHEDVMAANFNVYDLADEVIGMLSQQAQGKNIALENLIGHGLAEIRSDYVKCRHIIQNLLSNAVKFTEQGQVVIKAEQVENEMIITVADTGIGIPEEELPFIFDEFRQVDGSSSKKFGGTGLGLAIAKKYSKLLHGEIRVESKPGVGSTFILILPMKLNPYKTSEISEETPVYRRSPKPAEFHASDSGAGKTLLLFEDSEAAIIQITDILTEQSYTVHVARNGTEALEQIKLFKPDAVILDLMMPEVDGFQVLKMIRETPETSRIPVLILTAKHITKEELSFLKGNHIYQFIQKGDVGRIELLSTVDNMVNPKPETVKQKKSGHRMAERKGKPLILVVEDNPDNMKTVKAILSPGYIILEAYDGSEGVQQALAHKPDLILMDMSLPVMDGFEAFDAIRKSEEHKHIPVIALTASAMKGSREEILEYGFDDYISKPIDEPMFWRVLNYYLGGPD
ncbi:MAG: response regulator [Bacteroidetes bacterium]|nr:response regulator [Bacteroidota bacterium]